MTALSVFLAIALVAALAAAAALFVRWQSAKDELHRAEKELAAARSPQDLEDRFKVLSQEILDRQGQRAEKGLENMLGPVRDEVAEFKRRVDELIRESRSTKDILGEKFSRMDDSVARLSGDAKDLADALRGEAKLRGDWGETVLRRILESAGLRENESFDLQRTFEVDGSHLRPDAVLRLPDGRQVAIDSKVSLVAYDEYHQAADDERRKKAAKSLREAVERQVEETARYNDLPGATTPGFTFMFMPIEPAWLLVMSEHADLFEKAQRRGVIIIGPTNLMAALKVVDQMWLAEHKVRNMNEVFAVAGRVVDAVQKLIERVGRMRKQLDTVSRTLDEVDTSIKGRQGVLSTARRLQDYGGRGKAPLPEAAEGEVEALEGGGAAGDGGENGVDVGK